MAKKSAKAAEVEVEVDEEIELDETEADVESDDKPAKSKGQPAVEFGVADLAKYLTDKLDGDKKVTPRDLRTLIRKMAREDEARVDREITPGNRTRYNWPGGLKHPEVKRICEAVLGGEMEADKKAKLEELKAQKAAKTAAKKDAKGGKSKGKGKGKVVEADDEVVEIDIDEDED